MIDLIEVAHRRLSEVGADCRLVISPMIDCVGQAADERSETCRSNLTLLPASVSFSWDLDEELFDDDDVLSGVVFGEFFWDTDSLTQLQDEWLQWERVLSAEDCGLQIADYSPVLKV